MEEKTLIKRSPYGLYVQIIFYGVFALIVGLLASWLFRTLLHWTEGAGGLLVKWTWILFVIVWVAAAIKLWFDWRVKRYEIGQDMLVVHAKAGKFGSAQTVYRYESIVSLHMRQSMLGKMFGYGDVLLTIPKIDGQVVLNDIEDPEKQVNELQNRLRATSQQTASSLIT